VDLPLYSVVPSVYTGRPHSLTPPDATAEDVIDEALELFRANCFFRNYEIQGNGDRALIYLILFIGECLGKVRLFGFWGLLIVRRLEVRCVAMWLQRPLMVCLLYWMMSKCLW
jgi:hypothetical protein